MASALNGIGRWRNWKSIQPGSRPIVTLLAEEIEASVAKEPGVLMLHAVSAKGRTLEDPHPGSLCQPAGLRSPSADARISSDTRTLTAGMVRSLTLVEVDPIVHVRQPATHRREGGDELG